MPDQIALWCLAGVLDCSGDVPTWVWWLLAIPAVELLAVIVLIAVTIWRSR